MTRALSLADEINVYVQQRELILSLFYGTSRAIIQNNRPVIIDTPRAPVSPERQVNIVRLLALDAVLPEKTLFEELFRGSWEEDYLVKYIDESLHKGELKPYEAYWQAGLAHLGFLWLWHIYRERRICYRIWKPTDSERPTPEILERYYPPQNRLYYFRLVNEYPKIRRLGLGNLDAFAALQRAHPNPYQPWSWLLRWFNAFSDPGSEDDIQSDSDLIEIFILDLLNAGAFPEPAEVLCHYLLSVLTFLKGNISQAQQMILEKIPQDRHLPAEVIQHCLFMLHYTPTDSKTIKSSLRKTIPGSKSSKTLRWNDAKLTQEDAKPIQEDDKLTQQNAKPIQEDTKHELTQTVYRRPFVSYPSKRPALSFKIKYLQLFCALISQQDIATLLKDNPDFKPLSVLQQFDPELKALPDEKDSQRWAVYQNQLPHLLNNFVRADALIKQHIQRFSHPEASLLETHLKMSYEQLHQAFHTQFLKKHMPRLLRADPHELKTQQAKFTQDLQLINQVLPEMTQAFDAAQQLIRKQRQAFKNRSNLTGIENRLKKSLLDLEDRLMRQLLHEHIPTLLQSLGESRPIQELAHHMKTALFKLVLDWPIEMLELEATRLEQEEQLPHSPFRISETSLSSSSLTTAPEEDKTTALTPPQSDSARPAPLPQELPPLTSLSPRRASLQLIRKNQHAINQINHAFLNQQISPQEHKKQVTEQLKNLTQGRAAQHQKPMTCIGLVVANLFIALLPALYWLFRPLIKKNQGSLYSGLRGQFFTLKPQRVVVIEQITHLIEPLIAP